MYAENDKIFKRTKQKQKNKNPNTTVLLSEPRISNYLFESIISLFTFMTFGTYSSVFLKTRIINQSQGSSVTDDVSILFDSKDR